MYLFRLEGETEDTVDCRNMLEFCEAQLHCTGMLEIRNMLRPQQKLECKEAERGIEI